MFKSSFFLILAAFIIAGAYAIGNAHQMNPNGEEKSDIGFLHKNPNPIVRGNANVESISDSVSEAWVARYNGPGNSDDHPAANTALAIDSSGNVYITGKSRGLGTMTDYATIKYNSTGEQQWVARYNGSANTDDNANAIAVDKLGNVYVTGDSRGLGTFTDYATIKYDSSGVEQWVARYNGPGNYLDYAISIAVDEAGNVYVTGYSYDQSPNFGLDYATIKYNSSGVQQWVARFNLSLNSAYGFAIAVDELGNVYVTGSSFDSTAQVSSYVYATVKYNSSGVLQWVARYNGPGDYDPGNPNDFAKSIAVDSNGDVYVTGESIGEDEDYDFTTVKYNNSGVGQWVARYNGPGNDHDRAKALCVDSNGDVYVTGYSTGSGTNYDYATIKYNSSGVLQWVARYNGPGNDYDYANSLDVDTLGNVYVTGGSIGSGTSYDCATIKYNSSGVEQWVARHNGPENSYDYGYAIKVKEPDDFYVTGVRFGSGTSYDYLTIKYSQGSLQILSPVLNQMVVAGEQDTIRWRASSVEGLDISYSLDDGITYEDIVLNYPADSSYYVWEVPDSLLSRKAKIRISEASNGQNQTVSEQFRIKGYELTRINSNGDYERFQFGADRWNFPNSQDSMWPQSWWNQFNYHSGIDPYTNAPYPTSVEFDWSFLLALPDDFPDWPLFVESFGPGECYQNNAKITYKPSATTRWASIRNRWKGSCFGFAVSTILYFKQKADFLEAYPIPNAIDLSHVQLDNGVRKVINKLWLHQFGKQHQAFRKHAIHKTPTESLREIRTSLLSDGHDQSVLCLENNGSGGGAHGINAYRVLHIPNSSLSEVHVYDSSEPNVVGAFVVVDTLANGGAGSWNYTHRPHWGGLTGLYVSDAARTYLSTPILNEDLTTIAGNPEVPVVEIYSTIYASIVITDPFGNTLGYSDSLIMDSIPGAMPFIPGTGSMTPPYGYVLPEGTYSIYMTHLADSLVKLSIFSDSTIFAYRRVGATQAQTDEFNYDGKFSVSNPDSNPKAVTITAILIEDTTREKVFHVADCRVEQNDTMRFERTHHDNLTVVNVGSQKSYRLYVELASETSNPRFAAMGISLDANSSHQIAPMWTDLQTVTIYIDHGINGTIDDSLIVGNTLDVPEQGVFAVPNEFHLSQNFPNPFNPITTIQYALPSRSVVTLKVFDMLGREVTTLVDGMQDSGFKSVQFDASNLSSGIYFYTMRAGEFVSTKKLLLLR